MNKNPSISIKVIAFLFLIGGLLNFSNSIIDLTVTNTVNQSGTIKDFIRQLIDIITLIFAVLSFLTGWYLIKMKRWAYILGLILIIFSLATHIIVIVQVNATRWWEFFITLAALISLIQARKEFKRN